MKTLFFNILRIAMEQQKSFSVVPTAKQWHEVFGIAVKQTLVGVLFAGIERLPAEQRPPREILLKWYALTERIKQNNRLLNKRAVETEEYFANEGFACCILKGQGVAAYYPNPLLRTSGDIDIWLSGGCKRIHAFARSRVGLQGLTYQHIHYPLYKDVEIEVHTTPGSLSNPSLNCKLQQYFKNSFKSRHFCRVSLPEDIGEITVPDTELNLFYLLLHMYKHLLGEGIGLRQMMDYYYTLQQPIDADVRERVVQRLKEFKMLRFARATMYVMREVFCMDEALMFVAPDEEAGKFLLDEIMLSGNFGKYDVRIDRKNHHKLIPRVWTSIRRNIRFLQYYPNEVLWNPIFRTWQYCWSRRVKG